MTIKNDRINPSFKTTVDIFFPLAEKARQHRIKWVDAMRIGLTMLLAEKGVEEYSTDLTIVRRMDLMRKQLEEATQKLNELQIKDNEKKA